MEKQKNNHKAFEVDYNLRGILLFVFMLPP